MNGLEELNKKKIKFRRKTYRDKKLKDCRGCVYSDENPEVLSSPCYMYKTGKKFEIELVDPKCEETVIGRPRLYVFDCPNILEQFKDRISDDECKKALDTLIAYFVQENICKMEVNIDERDYSLAPEKEMTIEDIENRLGHKIKIVSKKEKNG